MPLMLTVKRLAKMENLKKIEDLLLASNNLKESINKFKNVYKVDTKRYDKIGFGFNEDDRFKACDGFTLWLSTWKGVYGDSGCANILNIDKAIFNKHLFNAINKRKWELLNEVIETIQAEAATLKEEALKELNEKLERVNAL